jgi:hypothetical protein
VTQPGAKHVFEGFDVFSEADRKPDLRLLVSISVAASTTSTRGCGQEAQHNSAFRMTESEVTSMIADLEQVLPPRA